MFFPRLPDSSFFSTYFPADAYFTFHISISSPVWLDRVALFKVSASINMRRSRSILGPPGFRPLPPSLPPISINDEDSDAMKCCIQTLTSKRSNFLFEWRTQSIGKNSIRRNLNMKSELILLFSRQTPPPFLLLSLTFNSNILYCSHSSHSQTVRPIEKIKF